MNETTEVIISNEKTIAAYEPFLAQLGELKEANSKAVFDYEDTKGNKDARSHIYKLKRTKTAVDTVRKEQKKASLEYGRNVDSQAKEIIADIEEMIAVHQAPIDVIENREKERIASINKKLDELSWFSDTLGLPDDSVYLKSRLAELREHEPDESLNEFMAEGVRIFKNSVLKLEEIIADAEKREAEQVELEYLRKEIETLARNEREEKIAQAAADKARRDTEEKAKADAEKKDKEAREAIRAVVVENERIRMEALKEVEEVRFCVENAEKEAVRRVEEKGRKEAEDAVKRESNRKHRTAIKSAALNALIKEGMPKISAMLAVKAIAKGSIPNVKIFY